MLHHMPSHFVIYTLLGIDGIRPCYAVLVKFTISSNLDLELAMCGSKLLQRE